MRWDSEAGPGVRVSPDAAVPATATSVRSAQSVKRGKDALLKIRGKEGSVNFRGKILHFSWYTLGYLRL